MGIRAANFSSTWRGVWRLWLAMVMSMSATATAQTLPAAGDGEHLWVVQARAKPDQFTVFHRVEGDKPRTLSHVQTLHGRLAEQGITAASGTLWLVYTDGTVQTIEAERAKAGKDWVYQERIRRDLPKSATVRAMTVHHDTLWAVLRITSADTLKQLDRPTDQPSAKRLQSKHKAATNSADQRLNLAIGLPPDVKADSGSPHKGNPQSKSDSPNQSNQSKGPHNTQAKHKQAKEDQAEPKASEDSNEAKANANEQTNQVSEDRLVRLRGDRWQKVPLPKDWSAPRSVALIGLDEGSSDVVLICATSQAEDQALEIDRHRGDSWQRTTIEGAGQGPMDAVVVDQQIVIGRPASGGKPSAMDGAALTLRVLRKASSTKIGTLRLEQAAAGQWALVPMGFDVGILAGQRQGPGDQPQSGPPPSKPSASKPKQKAPSNDQSLGLLLAKMDLQGQVVMKPVPLLPKPEPTFLDQADYLIMIAVLALATGLMLLFWQRDPRKQRLRLPEGYVLGSLVRRSLAGVIDVVPPILIGLFVFDMSARELVLHWPGQPEAASWADLVPGLTVIGIIIAHTTIAELLWGRSLGKALSGLQVRSLSSRPAKPGQILVRGLLRLFDLIAWLLLLLPILSPFRQRLGDLVARTVVVMAKPKTQEPDTDQNSG